jgi:hypothetical protein
VDGDTARSRAHSHLKIRRESLPGDTFWEIHPELRGSIPPNRENHISLEVDMHVHLEAVSLFITNGAEKRLVEERPRVRFLFTSKDDPLRKWINVLKILDLPM